MRKRFLASCLLASGFLAGCAAINSPSGQPASRKPTTLEQVMVWNANLADANLAIARGIIAANEAGEIDVPTSNKILTQQSLIADADRQLTPVLAAACVVPVGSAASTAPACNPAILSGNGSAIQAFLNQIKASASALVTDGTAGIKNAQKQKAVADSITAVSQLADEMLAALQQLGILH